MPSDDVARQNRELLGLVSAILDGEQPDWEGIDKDTSGSDPELIRVLKAIAAVASYHRTQQHEPGSD